jgi:hypothetical protein
MITPSSITGTLDALNATLEVNTETADNVLMQTIGTWVGTIAPEISLNGTDWVSSAVKASTTTNAVTLVTTITANGIHELFATGIPFFRLRMSAYTSGTATVIVHGDRQAK